MAVLAALFPLPKSPHRGLAGQRRRSGSSVGVRGRRTSRVQNQRISMRRGPPLGSPVGRGRGHAPGSPFSIPAGRGSSALFFVRRRGEGLRVSRHTSRACPTRCRKSFAGVVATLKFFWLPCKTSASGLPCSSWRPSPKALAPLSSWRSRHSHVLEQNFSGYRMFRASGTWGGKTSPRSETPRGDLSFVKKD